MSGFGRLAIFSVRIFPNFPPFWDTSFPKFQLFFMASEISGFDLNKS